MTDINAQHTKSKRELKKLSLDKVANYLSTAGNILGCVYVDRKTKTCKYLELKSPKGISFYVRIPENIEIREPTKNNNSYKIISMKNVLSVPKLLESKYKCYPDIISTTSVHLYSNKHNEFYLLSSNVKLDKSSNIEARLGPLKDEIGDIDGPDDVIDLHEFVDEELVFVDDDDDSSPENQSHIPLPVDLIEKGRYLSYHGLVYVCLEFLTLYHDPTLDITEIDNTIREVMKEEREQKSKRIKETISTLLKRHEKKMEEFSIQEDTVNRELEGLKKSMGDTNKLLLKVSTDVVKFDKNKKTLLEIESETKVLYEKSLLQKAEIQDSIDNHLDKFQFLLKCLLS